MTRRKRATTTTKGPPLAAMNSDPAPFDMTPDNPPNGPENLIEVNHCTLQADTEDMDKVHTSMMDSLGAVKEDTNASHKDDASMPMVKYEEKKDEKDDKKKHTCKECSSYIPRCQPMACNTQKDGTQVVPKDGAPITISLKEDLKKAVEVY